MFVYVGDILVFACLKTFQKHITLLHPLLLYSVYIVFRCEHGLLRALAHSLWLLYFVTPSNEYITVYSFFCWWCWLFLSLCFLIFLQLQTMFQWTLCVALEEFLSSRREILVRGFFPMLPLMTYCTLFFRMVVLTYSTIYFLNLPILQNNYYQRWKLMIISNLRLKDKSILS